MENRVTLVMLARSNKFVAAFVIDVLIISRPENEMIPYKMGHQIKMIQNLNISLRTMES